MTAIDAELVSVPDTLDIEYDWDEDRGRTLLRTSRFGAGEIVVRYTAAYLQDPGGFMRVWVSDDEGRDSLLFSDRISDTGLERRLDRIDRDDPPFTTTYQMPTDRGEIISQYEDGVYDRVGPGPVDMEIEFGSYTFDATTRIPLPGGAKVRENVSIEDVSLDRQGKTVTPTLTVSNPADHGVSLPIRAEGDVGGVDVYSSDLTIDNISGSMDVFGSRTSTVELPAFDVGDRIYPSNTLTYSIAPQGWASGWVGSESATTTVPDISTSDVSITDCAIAPQQVTVPEEVTLTATVSNPTPGRVDADVRFVLAGEETFTKQPVGGDSQRTFETTYATSEPGEATGEVFLDDVVPL